MPPSPSSDQNLAPNLTVLGDLRNAADGVKLWFEESTGLFSAQLPGTGTTLSRTFSSQTVTSDRYFGNPIREIFRVARTKIGGTVTQQTFDRALEGLSRLRRSYEGTKLAALDSIIADAELNLRRESDAIVALRKKHLANLVYGFAQAMFLDEANPGVCYSFTLDWARRITIAGGGQKKSFAHGKHGWAAKAPALDAAQKRRIHKKVASRINPLQTELRDWETSSFGNVATAFRAADEDAPTPRERQLIKFRDLRVLTRVQSHQAIAIAEQANGSAVVAAARNKTAEEDDGASVFLLNMKSRGAHGGHTVGLHLLANGTLHFFDPNIGEFAFSTGQNEKAKAFFDDWWALCYVGGNGVTQFESWTLEGVVRRT